MHFFSASSPFAILLVKSRASHHIQFTVLAQEIVDLSKVDAQFSLSSSFIPSVISEGVVPDQHALAGNAVALFGEDGGCKDRQGKHAENHQREDEDRRKKAHDLLIKDRNPGLPRCEKRQHQQETQHEECRFQKD